MATASHRSRTRHLARHAAIGLAILAGQPLATGEQQPRSSGIDVRSLSTAVRPQDDLYTYVNGRWHDETPIPPQRVLHSAATEIQDRVFRQLHEIIEEILAGEPPRRGSARQQIADLYRSIVDEETIERLGARPIQKDVDRIFTIQKRSDMANEAGRLASAGRGGPFEASLAFDPSTPGLPAVRLSQSGIMLPDRSYYLDDLPVHLEARASYERYLIHIFTLVGRPTPAEDAAALLGLEHKLAEAQLPRADSRDLKRASSRLRVDDLEREMPGFDWAAWARPQGIRRDVTVVLAQPTYFKRFAELAATEPIEAWRAWLAARLITSAAPFLSEDFASARFEFFGRLLTGQEEPIQRWRRGVSLVNGYLGEALGRMYVERHFAEDSRRRVDRIVAYVRDAYRETIEASDWLAPSTRAEALRKLSTLTVKVAHPERWRSYAGLEIRPDDLIGNIERAKRFEMAYRSRALSPDEVRSTWMITPQTSNAYYATSSHEIVVAAAMLQPPYFDPTADEAVNYGAIGAVIGHEIGHALDNRGRLFDADGRMRDWWTPDDDTEYRLRAAALVSQYDAYRPLPDVPVNGRLTLSENLGDLVGLSAAHKAWQKSLLGRPSPVLDSFTGDQRFFIGWARIWREQQREEFLRQFLLSNPHAPAEFRTNGTVSNLPAFYAAFDVQPGDGLFRPPDQRVRIW